MATLNQLLGPAVSPFDFRVAQPLPANPSSPAPLRSLPLTTQRFLPMQCPGGVPWPPALIGFCWCST